MTRLTTKRTRSGLALAAFASAAVLLAGPGPAHADAYETSSDTMDHHEARSGSPDQNVAESHEMHTVGSGEPIEAQSGAPDVVGADSPDAHEARSQDAGDLRYEAPQAGASSALMLPRVTPSQLASPEAAAAFDRLKAAKREADAAARAYATMIRRGYPTGSAREAIVARRDTTRRAFDEALARFEAAQAG